MRMKEKKIQEVRGDLEKIEEALRRYCHSEGCREIHVCPNFHEECAKRLGLDTSIAWELAGEVRLLAEGIEKDSRWIPLYLRDAARMADICEKVVRRHERSFPELYRLVLKVLDTLGDVESLVGRK